MNSTPSEYFTFAGELLPARIKTASGDAARKALPVKPVKVDRDKVSRAYAVTPLCEAGRVYLPQGAPWLATFLDEHSSLPNATHDDTVDTTTQALNFLRGSGPSGIFLYHEELARDTEKAKPEVLS